MFRMLFQVCSATFIFARPFRDGFLGLAETERDEKLMNALFIAFFKVESETIIGLNPSVQCFLETGEKSRLNSLEFTLQNAAINIFLTSLAGAVRQDIGAGNTIFRNFLVGPGSTSDNDVNIVFLTDTISKRPEKFDYRVDFLQVSVEVGPFYSEFQGIRGINDYVWTIQFFAVQHRVRGKWHIPCPPFNVL